MSNQFEAFQKTTKTQIESLTASSEAFTRGLKSVAEETAAYTKRSIEATTAFFEKLKDLKSFESAIQLQTEFTKTQFESFVGQMTKIGEIYKGLGQDLMKPVETAVAAGKETIQH